MPNAVQRIMGSLEIPSLFASSSTYFWRYFVLLVFNYLFLLPPPAVFLFWTNFVLYLQYISMITEAKLANCCCILMTNEGHLLVCLVECLCVAFPSSLLDEFSSSLATQRGLQVPSSAVSKGKQSI